LVYYILLIILLFISLVIIKDFGNILQYGLTALIVFDYIGYAGVEQILFGLLSVKLASFLPKDLNSVYLLNIPEALILL